MIERWGLCPELLPFQHPNGEWDHKKNYWSLARNSESLRMQRPDFGHAWQQHLGPVYLHWMSAGLVLVTTHWNGTKAFWPRVARPDKDRHCLQGCSSAGHFSSVLFWKIQMHVEQNRSLLSVLGWKSSTHKPCSKGTSFFILPCSRCCVVCCCCWWRKCWKPWLPSRWILSRPWAAFKRMQGGGLWLCTCRAGSRLDSESNGMEIPVYMIRRCVNFVGRIAEHIEFSGQHVRPQQWTSSHACRYLAPNALTSLFFALLVSVIAHFKAFGS